jgi:hypothetical protein
VSKQTWLDWAELVDSYRVFPRLFLMACFWWVVVVGQDLLNWYIALPKDERGIEATGFASVVFLGILGFLKLVYNTYSAAGRAWGEPASTTSSTVVATTTETSA